MQYKLMDSLGTQDAEKCNDAFKAEIDIKRADLRKGALIELNDASAKYLKSRYPALLAPPDTQLP